MAARKLQKLCCVRGRYFCVKASGTTVIDVCREHQISEQTFHRWKREFGMLEVDQAKQLKELKKENERLKRMLADEMLGKELLKEALEKKL